MNHPLKNCMSLNWETLLGSLFIIYAPLTNGEETIKPLPPAAQDLADKLIEWEAQQQASLDTRIAEKRIEIAKMMEGILSKETAAGNLDGAIKMREYIEFLKNAKSTSSSSMEKEASTSTTIARLLRNTEWTSPNGRGGVNRLSFDRRGDLIVNPNRETDYDLVEGPDGQTVINIHVFEPPLSGELKQVDDEIVAITRNGKVIFVRLE
ncbi:MAG: hypothetical protein AAGA96_12850 [Verrucomicrobiota bacterium]